MEYKAKKDLEVISFPLESAVTMLLKKGRERIERGWIKHRYVHEGGYCMLGAINYVDAYAGRIYTGPSRMAGRYLGEATGEPLPYGTDNVVGACAFWNDAPSRTKEEVLQVFDRAIVKSMECDNAI